MDTGGGEGGAGVKGEGEVGRLEMMTPLLPLPAYLEQQISFFIGGVIKSAVQSETSGGKIYGGC